jgi:hypothetical protein
MYMIVNSGGRFEVRQCSVETIWAQTNFLDLYTGQLTKAPKVFAFLFSKLSQTMSEAPALRIVPGAPPPTPLTKSQKKKRRAANAQGKGDEHDLESPVANGHGLNSALDSALVETAPAISELNPSLVSKPEDVANAAIASDAGADILSPTSLLNLPSKKTSAIVELVNKRHRTLHKKIVRSFSHLYLPRSMLLAFPTRYCTPISTRRDFRHVSAIADLFDTATDQRILVETYIKPQ